MSKIIISVFVGAELLTIALQQVEIISQDILSLLIQLPFTGLFLWYVTYSSKTNREQLSALLADKDTDHQKTIDLFTAIIDRLYTSNTELGKVVGENNRQMAINTSVVNDNMRLNELLEEFKKLYKAE